MQNALVTSDLLTTLPCKQLGGGIAEHDYRAGQAELNRGAEN